MKPECNSWHYRRSVMNKIGKEAVTTNAPTKKGMLDTSIFKITRQKFPVCAKCERRKIFNTTIIFFWFLFSDSL